jgi:hypothetical protein
MKNKVFSWKQLVPNEQKLTCFFNDIEQTTIVLKDYVWQEIDLNGQETIRQNKDKFVLIKNIEDRFNCTYPRGSVCELYPTRITFKRKRKC